MTAVLRFPGRERTAFCRLIMSRALGSPLAGSYGGPGPSRTLPSPSTSQLRSQGENFIFNPKLLVLESNFVPFVARFELEPQKVVLLM